MIRRRKISFLNISDVWFDRDQFYREKEPIVILHTPEVINNKKLLVKVEKTFVIDLSMPQENIFANFKKSARYPINKAIKDGVIVDKVSNREQADSFYKFFTDFSSRKKIPPMKRDELDNYEIFYAISPEGEYLGGCAFVKAADKSVFRYKHGATSYKNGENDLILWEAIKFAKINGYRTFDFGGVTVTDNKKSYYYRHFKFKEKFGGDLTDFYTYIILSPVLLWLYPISLFIIKFDLNKLTNILSCSQLLKNAKK